MMDEQLSNERLLAKEEGRAGTSTRRWLQLIMPLTNSIHIRPAKALAVVTAVVRLNHAVA